MQFYEGFVAYDVIRPVVNGVEAIDADCIAIAVVEPKDAHSLLVVRLAQSPLAIKSSPVDAAIRISRGDGISPGVAVEFRHGGRDARDQECAVGGVDRVGCRYRIVEDRG